MKIFWRECNDSQNILRCASAVVAYLFGSGFASGQEVMQFFTAYGPVYGGVGGLITLVLIVWCIKRVMLDADKIEHEDVNEIYIYYCGIYVGSILKWMMPIFLYCIYVIMISGAGVLLEEYYGLPNFFGQMMMVILSLITVIQGIEKITDIIGFIGSLILILTIVISAFSIISNPIGIFESMQIAQSLPIKRATSHWWLSGINYGTFSGLILIPFLVSLGKNMTNKRNAVNGGMIGGGLFALTAILMNYGMLSYINEVHDKSVPTVLLANLLFKDVGTVFALVMLAGIYTTAVPMLWTSVKKLARSEKSTRYKWITILLSTIALFGGKIPFKILINTTYPYMGYVGIIVFIGILLKELKLILNGEFS